MDETTVGRWVKAAKAYEAATGREKLAKLEQLRADLDQERRELLVDLAAWNNQRALAKVLGISQPAVSKQLQRAKAHE